MTAPAADEQPIGPNTPERGPGGMYVAESGSPGAPAILFIHGVGQSGRIWRRHLELLGEFHCLAPDLPGFGRSNHLPGASNAHIVRLLAELIASRVPARRAHAVGVSWGALLALVLLSRHPGLTASVIGDGAPIYWPRGSRPFFLYLATALLPFLRTPPVRALFGNVMDEADLRVASRLAFWRAFVGSMADIPPLAEASSPTLLVAGEREHRVRPANAALATLMPGAEAWFVPARSHVWQLEDPDLHIRMVEAWVKEQALPAELRREPKPAPAAVEQLRTSTAGSRRTVRPRRPRHRSPGLSRPATKAAMR